MKKQILKILLMSFVFYSCNPDDDKQKENITVTLKFTHHWDGVPITAADFNNFKYITQNGEIITIERLRYLTILNFIYPNFRVYTLRDLKKESTLKSVYDDVFHGTYEIKFNFGFWNDANIDGNYVDLNSENFNVPLMLGGGYHYMQFDGKFKDSNNQDANFNYHVIRAVDRTDPNNLIFEDTSFEVNLGTITIIRDTTIEIKMNVAEWFKNPNLWDLNVLNTLLMPNFNAQKMMSENGRNVFSLGEISNE